MKIIYILTAITLLTSCKKDTTPDNNNNGGGTTDVNVSGKLKKIIQSITGTRTAYITTLEFDATNRLLKFNEWKDDSTFTPIKITEAHYSTFSYNGTSNFPTKNTVTNETGLTDSSLYFYDASNNIIKEDYYRNNVVITRNAYTITSPTLTKRIKSYSNGSGTLVVNSNDSIVYDNQGKVNETRFYSSSNVYKGKDTYGYDTKSNPLSSINVFKVVHSLYGDDRKDFYNATNNLTNYNNINGSSLTSISFTYNYSTNLFPVSGSATLTSGSPSVTQSSTLRYEYY